MNKLKINTFLILIQRMYNSEKNYYIDLAQSMHPCIRYLTVFFSTVEIQSV